MQKFIYAFLLTFSLAACANSSDAQTASSANPISDEAPFGGGGSPNPCFQMSPEACETFRLTNIERRKHGLKALTFSSPSYRMAQEQSSDMANRDYFDHQRPAFNDRPAESFSHRAARFGLSIGVGENIAMCKSAAKALELWMNSAGHRKNILNPKYKSFAVGYKDGLYTQVFSVVDGSR